jgi:hypothetical protein
MIRVLHLQPGQKPEVKDVGDDLESLVALIGYGYIQAVPITDDGLAMFCDEDGQRKNLSFNCRLGAHTILGRAIIVRRNDPDLGSLTDDDVARIMEFVSQ